MYYHGLENDDSNDDGFDSQYTRVAVSNDGISFESGPEKLGSPYFRVFSWDGWYYALAKEGTRNQTNRGITVYRSKDGLGGFEKGPTFLCEGVRHTGVTVSDETLQLFYSRIGDAPERILLTEVDLTEDWWCWEPSSSTRVLEPERGYEGVDRRINPSTNGSSNGKARQLRDPEVFTSDSDDTYLFYSVAGESGIAIAKIVTD